MAYTDNFTDANGTYLPTHDANWVKVTADTEQIYIQSNQASGDDSSLAMYLYNQTAAEAHYAKCKVTLILRAIGPCIRVSSGSGGNGYYCFPETDNAVYNGEGIAGSYTDWDSGLSLPAANSVIELSIDASTTTTVYYKDDGAIVQTYTGKSALSGGKFGICSNGGGHYADDWEGGDVGGGTISLPPKRKVNILIRM